MLRGEIRTFASNFPDLHKFCNKLLPNLVIACGIICTHKNAVCR